MKNILIISASPRKGGNSDTLCDRFAQGAEESGHKVEKVFLAAKKLGTVVAAVCAIPHTNAYRKMTWQRSLTKWLRQM